MSVLEEVQRVLDKTEPPPKMIHIALMDSDRALCGWKFSRVYNELADGTEDCVVCVDIWRAKYE